MWQGRSLTLSKTAALCMSLFMCLPCAHDVSVLVDGLVIQNPDRSPRLFLPNSLHKEQYRPGSLPSESGAASVTTVSQGLANWLAANLRQPIWGSGLALLAVSAAAAAAAAAAANSAAAAMDDGPHVAFVGE